MENLRLWGGYALAAQMQFSTLEKNVQALIFNDLWVQNTH
jgi:hypothetical protein